MNISSSLRFTYTTLHLYNCAKTFCCTHESRYLDRPSFRLLHDAALPRNLFAAEIIYILFIVRRSSRCQRETSEVIARYQRF